jgi:hypothetical protein
MARHRTRKQISIAKRSFYERLTEGAEVIAMRYLSSGESIMYRATVSIRADGRVDLLAVGMYKAKAPFKPSEDKAVPGYRDWYFISGLHVCVAGRYRSIIAAIMEMAPYSE